MKGVIGKMLVKGAIGNTSERCSLIKSKAEEHSVANIKKVIE